MGDAPETVRAVALFVLAGLAGLVLVGLALRVFEGPKEK